MKCEDVLRELSVVNLDKMSFRTAWRVRRHLQSCSVCAGELAATRRLEDGVREWRADAPPAHLQGRIAAAVARAALEDRMSAAAVTGSEPRNTRRSPLRFKTILEDRKMTLKLTFALAAIGIGAGFFGFHLSPAVAEAEVVRRMTAAIQSVRTAHVVWRMTDYKTDNDTVLHHATLDQVEEDWYQNGRTRKEGVWGSRLIVGANDAGTDTQGKKFLQTAGTYYRYDARAGKVTAVPEMGLQYSRFTLEEFAGDLASRDPKSMETLGFVRLNGQAAREISIAFSRPAIAVNHDPAPGDSREICWVSVYTDLPVRIADERYESGIWRTTSQIDFEFNQKLPAALFDPATLGR